MIIPGDKARRWYDTGGKKYKRNIKGKVGIFVSNNVDSGTSLRILVGLFKIDIIPYEIIPVQSSRQFNEKLDDYKEFKSTIVGVVAINCVGENDLSSAWFCLEEYHSCDIIGLIVDSKHPGHHKNINDKSRLVVIDDSMHNLTHCPTNEEMEEVENIQDEDDFISDNEDDNSEDNQNKEEDAKEEAEEEANANSNAEANAIKKGKIVKKKGDGDEDLKEDDNESESNKNIKPEKTPLQLKIEALHRKREKVHSYYSGTYYGYPSTYIFYSIASQLHREDSSYLWYLIISLTDEYLKYHFSDKHYEYMFAICQSEVLKLFQKKKPMTGGKAKTEIEKKFESTAKDVKTILIDTDYKLYLYRHWTGFDSFIYSTYPGGSLSTWKEPGRAEIQKLFAYVGIPGTEAKQKYRYMRSEFKDSFKKKIIEISKRFDLGNLLFHSFIYQFDANTEMSASDCVYLLSAVLEYPFDEIGDLEIEDDIEETNSTKNNEEGNKDKIKGEKNEKLSEIKVVITISKAKNLNSFLKKFWGAYSFLSLKKLNMTQSLIDIAIRFQIALANTACMVVDKKSIATFEKFRYTIINSNLTDESKYFHYPSNLEKLSTCIMEIYKLTRGKKAENKPYLLAMLNAEKKSYYVHGNGGCNRDYDDQKNEFGIRFRYAEKKLKINAEYEFNTEDIVTINKDDLFAFIQEISAI